MYMLIHVMHIIILCICVCMYIHMFVYVFICKHVFIRDTVFESGSRELTNYGVAITNADVRLIPIHTEIHITF